MSSSCLTPIHFTLTSFGVDIYQILSTPSISQPRRQLTTPRTLGSIQEYLQRKQRR
ncbi:hypothetical protein M404DRAFT_1001168 [Pisolithus tinctorius Marx 270]|uniref:Uncharacterized protein n=1 Tax=Pisolithus tinctorius Marx 270 TaxID=870435 RepID=A0A0C3NS54_PISTI|nr:hypothetical protein M404DRAFT_1001168 [Pisolithus tinctorius Marx 270]